ncbi:MAG TPA: ArsR family transcriptional regulator [Candidatus Limnocylindria bacterium]
MNLTVSERHFVEDMGRLMVAWSLPRTTGRVYAYLLLRPESATLDQIAKDLDVAKSGASVATRQLVAFGMARTHRRSGSKQLGFDAIYDLDALLAAREVQIRLFMERLREGARVASSSAARRKIGDMTKTVADVVGELTSLAQRGGRKGRRT